MFSNFTDSFFPSPAEEVYLFFWNIKLFPNSHYVESVFYIVEKRGNKKEIKNIEIIQSVESLTLS